MELIRRKLGFTLIELLVVVIIVAVLAAVGVPMLSANVQRAKLSEADAALGTMRTGMRAQLAEKGAYSIPTSLTDIGIASTDLNGRYFSQADYSITSVTAGPPPGFCAAVSGATGPAADASITGTTRSIDQDGYIYSDTLCKGTKLN